MKKLFTKITGILIFCILNGGLGMAQQLTVPHTSGCLNDTAFVPVNYSTIDSLGALTVYITYDTSVLTFAGFDNADALLPGLMCGVPASGPNAWQVVISWVGDPLDSAGVDLISGKLCDILFIYKGGNSDLDFLLTSELVKPDLTVINISYTDGSISPTIVSQPASSTICEDGHTGFYVTAVAGSTFQWQVRNGSLWEDLQDDATYAGVHTDSLHILQAHYSLNDNSYRCAITITCTQFSDTALLTVHPKPVIVTNNDTTICAGGSLVLDATGTSGSLPLQYFWDQGLGAGISHTVFPATTTMYHLAVTDTFGCSAFDSVMVSVIQSPSPAGIISGDSAVCPGQNNVSYSVPDINNATTYLWSYSGTGVIISGSTNPVTIDFSETATSGVLTVMGVNSCGNGTISGDFPVTVNSRPVPAITGPDSVCNGSTGVVYSTEAGLTGYSWSISAGGSITSGTGTNSVQVSWNIAGPQTISVNYTDVNGCTADTATTYDIMVNTLPVPAITGPDFVCNGSTGVVYSTEAGMTGYSWSISAGGSITSGAGTNSVQVSWNTAGPQTISVNYTDGNGCTAATATTYNVMVNTLPVPVITGADSVCNGSTGVAYSTEAGMTGYSWIISAGGSITSGAGTNSVQVSWNTAGPQTISVNYTDGNGCTAATATTYNVMVNTLPVPVITGADSVCNGSAGVAYSTEAGMMGYSWIISAGGSITSGTGTNSVLVTWNNAGPQTISVNYTDGNGCTAATATTYNVMVNTLPVPAITGPDSVCNGSTGFVYSTEAGMTGYSWSISPGGSITSGTGTNSVLV
ncbi:MAG TPA: hypothetical protein PKW80_11845, partial [Bacteroidales bacterium]|nr:hypothetical protein [Bacteroidales bacterium]